MWGKPPFSIADNYAVDVRNLAAVRKWYKEKLGFHEADENRQVDPGRPHTDLYGSNEETFLSLVQLGPGTSAEKGHVIFYAKNLEKAHQWLIDRGVTVQPATADSGGNRFFQFQDLEGNTIEVCVEP
jgi:catechol 2,3-dioxygenase-like lactoylglutathione lyase family enzyme